MRILHVTDTFAPTVGGIEALVEGMAAAQARAGHEVSVLTATAGPGAPAQCPYQLVRKPGRLDELLDRADVVHAHVSAHSPVALRAAVRAAGRRIPVLASVHSVWGRGWPLIAGWTWWHGCADLPIQWAGVSSLAAGYVTKALRPQAPVMIVPNAIETSRWAPRDRVPHDPGRARGPVTVISTMRMTSRKRPLPLLRMLRAVRAAVPAEVPMKAVLIGDGRQLPRVRRHVARHDLSWVNLPGVLPPHRLREVYATADLYVAPAVMESFGLAALEARASGLPVVAMARSGVADVLDHGVDSLLVQDDAAMVAAIAELATNASRRETMTRHCRAVAPRAGWGQTLTEVFGGYAAARAVAAGVRVRSWPGGLPMAAAALGAPRDRPSHQLALSARRTTPATHRST